MASDGPGNDNVSIPQIGHYHPYQIPAEVSVKCSQDHGSSRNKKKKSPAMKLNKNSSTNEIKSENLEGHKTFDNIEDILTFINGEISKEKVENGGDVLPNETQQKLQNQEQKPVQVNQEFDKMLETSVFVFAPEDPTISWEKQGCTEDFALHHVEVQAQHGEEKLFRVFLYNVQKDDKMYGNVLLDQVGFLPQGTHPFFELKDPSRSKEEVNTVGLKARQEYSFDIACKGGEEGLHKVDLVVRYHAKYRVRKEEKIREEKIVISIQMIVGPKKSADHNEFASVEVEGKSLGAIRKIRKVKRYGEKVIEGEKEKPDLSKPVGHFFQGWFAKKDSGAQPTGDEVESQVSDGFGDQIDELLKDTRETLSDGFGDQVDELLKDARETLSDDFVSMSKTCGNSLGSKNSLEASLQTNPIYSPVYLKELREKYDRKHREVDRKIAEQNIKKKFYGDKKDMGALGDQDKVLCILCDEEVNFAKITENKPYFEHLKVNFAKNKPYFDHLKTAHHIEFYEHLTLMLNLMDEKWLEHFSGITPTSKPKPKTLVCLLCQKEDRFNDYEGDQYFNHLKNEHMIIKNFQLIKALNLMDSDGLKDVIKKFEETYEVADNELDEQDSPEILNNSAEMKEAEIMKEAYEVEQLEEAEVVRASAANSVAELSYKFNEIWDKVEHGAVSISFCQAQLEALKAALEALTDTEERISEIKTLGNSKEVDSLMDLIGGVKKGLQINEKQTKLKQETSELTNKRIELLNEKITLTEELIKQNRKVQTDGYTGQFQDLDEENGDSKAFSITVLKEKMDKNKEILNTNENDLSICKKQLEELKTEKETQNQLLKETLDKIGTDASSFELPNKKPESPQKSQPSSPTASSDQLAIEHNPTTEPTDDEEAKPKKPLVESSYELTFHKTSLTTFRSSGKEELTAIMDNCALVLAATNWSVLEWGIDTPHQECHDKLDQENQKRRCTTEICKKCRHDMKGCGPDLRTCGRCDIVTKAIAYHEEYLRMVKVVEEKGGKWRAFKKQAEGFAKDAMRAFHNSLVPFLVTCIEGETTYFLEYQKDVPIEIGGACKLSDIWERLLYVKFSLRRVKIDQDFLVLLHQRVEDLRAAHLEYDDVLDDLDRYVTCWKELVHLWDSNVTPTFSLSFLQTEQDFESWLKCFERSKEIAQKAFDMVDKAEEACVSGVRAEIVDLKCVDAFLCSALSLTNAAKVAVTKKVPLKLMRRMHWAKELLNKIHCVQCRKIILIPGENLVHLDKCSKCKAVRYCNTTCQQLQWEEHQDKCGKLKKAEKRRKKEEARAGEKVAKKKEKFWETVIKPLLCTPGVTIHCLDVSLQRSSVPRNNPFALD